MHQFQKDQTSQPLNPQRVKGVNYLMDPSRSYYINPLHNYTSQVIMHGTMSTGHCLEATFDMDHLNIVQACHDHQQTLGSLLQIHGKRDTLSALNYWYVEELKVHSCCDLL